MHTPSMPTPFSGTDHGTALMLSVPGRAPVNFFGSDATSNIGKTQEQHWRDLDKFFADNEAAIQKAERSFLDPDKASEIGVAMDVFTDTANVVLDGLTALANVHPALGIAIFAFHGIIRLDLTRRDNDRKVLAVKLEMQTMMCAMFQFRKLRHVHVSEDDRDIENSRLQRLISRIADEIKACGSDLNYYSERNTVSRAISSKVYERRFAAHVGIFAQRRSELQSVVSAYTAVGVDTANIGIASIGEKVDVMNEKLDSVLALFQKMNTSRERDLLKFLEANGGAEKCIDDDRLLNRLLAMAGESKKTPTDGSDGREQQQQLLLVRKDLKNDLKNLDNLLTQNFSRFEKLLQIQANNLNTHMEDTSTKLDQIVANTMLIIDQGKLIEKAVAPTVVSTTLKDPVLQEIWERMGLKGSVKAKHFILNFRDHISVDRTPLATPYGSPLPTILELPPTENFDLESQSDARSMTDHVANQIFAAELKDEWALQYLTVSYVHPIIEAMDEDCSGFISIKEANKFARARPSGRSLISWMAYWAAGWHRNLTQYKDQIYSTILQMHALSKTALPHNKQLIISYLNSFKLLRVEALLRSIKSLSADSEIENDVSLNEYAAAIAATQEAQLTRNLDGVSYVLKSASDVKLVADHGKQRVENWILPVLHLVLKRHLDIIILAQKNLIHTEEMQAHETSLDVIFTAFDERLHRLEAIFQQVYRGNVDAHFEVFAYGMFFTSFKGQTFCPSDSKLHLEEWARYYETSNLVNELLEKDPPEIFILAKGLGQKYEFEDETGTGVQPAVEESGPEDASPLPSPPADDSEHTPHPFEGQWSARFSKRLPFLLIITSVKDGKISGKAGLIRGRGDITGDYKIENGAREAVLDFDVVMAFEDGYEETRFCSAVFDLEREVISGTWITKSDDPDDEFTHAPFVARRTPLDLYLPREAIDEPPSASSDSETIEPAELARRRWRFAIEGIRSQTKTRSDSKALTIARLDGRRNLIKLHYESYAKDRNGSFDTDSYYEMMSLGIPNSSQAFSLYHSLAKYRFDRMLDDCGIRYYSCDNCSESITHVRYQCITCTNEKFNSEVDLCHKCRDMDGVNSISRVTNFVHRTSHSLLRSTPRSWIKMHELAWIIPEARLSSEKVKARFRELATRGGESSSGTRPALGHNSKATQPIKCVLCKTPILALPAWICTSCSADDLICNDCVLTKSVADTEDHVLLRIFDSARVWPSEAKSTRLEEHIEDMESRINTAVADELSLMRAGLDKRMNTLESQVNSQLAEILSLMKLVLNSNRTP